MRSPLEAGINAGKAFVASHRPVKDARDSVEITQRLIQIPSYQTEAPLRKWITRFVRNHAPKEFNQITTLPTGKKGREALLVSNGDLAEFIIIGHMDTVAPWTVGDKQGQGQHKPFSGTIGQTNEGVKVLYGRGASDQKSGLGAMLGALASLKDHEGELPRVMFAFTSREEGDFGGMQAIVAHIERLQAENPDYAPQFILSTNGSNGEIGWQCRGVTELSFRLRGTSGHAALRVPGQPEPISVNEHGPAVLSEVRDRLAALPETTLGKSTTNTASFHGGLEQNGDISDTHANVSPDLAQILFEVRTNGTAINAETVTQLLTQRADAHGLRVEDMQVNLDLPAWLTPRNLISWLEALIMEETGTTSVPEWDAKQHGYDEIALLQAAASRRGQLPVGAAIYGIGDPTQFHAPDESVEVARIPHLQRIIERSITEFPRRRSAQ